MVNNYVKQKVVPAPRRKRYTRRHVASLLFVTAMKRVYSIGQIASMMGMIDRSDVDVSALYDEVVALLETVARAALLRRRPGGRASPH